MIIIDWIAFYLLAKTRFQIHSPKVFEFIESVLENKKGYYKFGEIEEVREILLNDHRTINFRDFGAGSKKRSVKKTKVSQIAKHSLADPDKIKLLFLISLWSKSKNILELGTSFGLSSLALAGANPKSKLTTIEGDPETMKIASSVFKRSKAKNISQIEGNFDNVLIKALQDINSLDLVLIDGNHTYEATTGYFKNILPYCHKNSILIFDDIYWSKGMQAAWQEIEQSEKVAFTINLFSYGLVFFDSSMTEKQNFKIIKSKWKPFAMGFWT